MSGAKRESARHARVRDLIRARDLEAAQTEAERLVDERPADAEARFMLGVVQAERQSYADAKANLEHAVALEPAGPWTRQLALSNVLRDSGDAPAAEAIARQLLGREPTRAQAHNALGLALHDQRRFDEAVAAFRQATSLDPRYIAAHLNLARSLEAYGNRDEAKAWYLRAARLDPGSAADAYRRLARLSYADADIFSTIAAYEEFVKLDDGNAEVWNLLGNAYMDVAAIAHAKRCYSTALAIDPDHGDIFDNLLLCHHYDPNFTAEQMFEAHREWARRFASGVSGVGVRPQRRSRERMRIGFLSQSLCSGPTGFFLLPLVRHLDRTRYEVHCYSAGFKNDDVSSELRARADAWRDVGSDSDDALAQRIAADDIDVLIDLAGHAPGNRLRAVARKPARVVVTWLDYFDTTGLDGVDFLIADSVSVPMDAGQRFTETVLRIDPSRLCYAPPEYAPAPVAPPALRNGFVTFGSFNRLAKLAEPVVDLWARLLHVVPDARLLLKSAAFNHKATCAAFASRFQQRGVEATRLELRGSSPHAQMLAEYGDLDIALDPFPYNGGLTTCEALWMGVPVVALLGDSMISRQSAALLYAAGIGEWVARGEDEWLAVAAALANDAPRLAKVRRGLRSQIAASPLVDGARFARAFEASLEGIASAQKSSLAAGIG